MSRGSLKVSVNYLAVPHKPMDAYTAQTWLKQLSAVAFWAGMHLSLSSMYSMAMSVLALANCKQ